MKNSGFYFETTLSPVVDKKEPTDDRRLGAVLHAGFGVFLKEVADVDREAFEFLV
jgi:hypothetical protein